MNLWHDNQGRLLSLWRFLLGLLVAFVANFIAIGVAFSLSHNSNRILEAVYRPLTLILLLVGYALLLMSADRVHEHFFAAMGLGRFSGWRRQTLEGLAIGTGLIVVAVVAMAIFGDLRATVSISSRTIWLAISELFILATAAMGEELMFRSYPFQRLREAGGPVVAVVVMSLLFGMAHRGNPHASTLAMLNTCVIGALLCVAYLRTGALWMSWGIHFAWNTALGLVFGLPVSGLTDFAVMAKTRASGPRWMTGGSYGIEGSWLGTIVIVLGLVPVVLLTRREAALARTRADATATPPSDGWEQQNSTDQPPPGRIQEY